MENVVRRYLDAWNTRDAAARRRAIEALFVEGCSYTDPMATVFGPGGVDSFIGSVQQQFAGVVFELGGLVDTHHDVARFTWHAVAKGSKEPLAIGFDVIVMDGDRIKQVVGFLDKSPS